MSATLRLMAALTALLGFTTQAAPAGELPKRALVVTTTAGFRHSSIVTAEKVLAELGKSSGLFNVEYCQLDTGTDAFKGADGKPDKEKVSAALKPVLAEKMSVQALGHYDLVIFANTSGELPLPDPEGFLNWIKEGHAFVGMHAATDTFRAYPPYVEMIGGKFRGHGPQVQVEAINQDPGHLSCNHLGSTWTVFDEIYQLDDFNGGKVHRLLSLNELMLNAKDVKEKKVTPGDYPIAWCRDYGKGRVFYTSLGHREDIWDPTWADKDGKRINSPEVARQYQQHIMGGIRWAARLEQSAAKKD